MCRRVHARLFAGHVGSHVRWYYHLRQYHARYVCHGCGCRVVVMHGIANQYEVSIGVPGMSTCILAGTALKRKCLVHDGLSHGRYATNFGIFVKGFFSL